MNPAQFEQLERIINRATFESTKESIAKQALYRNLLTSAQLREILEKFSFESTKLNFAKYAYGQVVDKQNIFLIYDAFTFDSSVRQLERQFRGW